MPADNQIASVVSRFQILPAPIRQRALSLVFGQVVPFVGTSKALYEEVTPERVVVSIGNRRRVRNHIGSVHAAAVTLAAETASGFVVGINLPQRSLPLIKVMRVDFQKRVKGTIRATATLTAEQRQHMLTAERGQIPVETHITDDSGGEPVVVEMLWAWVPRR